MRRDELRQPLHRRTASERLWSRRPGALAAAWMLAAFGFVALVVWAVVTPHPLAGEPMVTAAIPPVTELDIASASITEPEVALDAEPLPEEAEAEATSGARSEEATIIVPGRRPLPPAPIASVTEDSPAGPLPRIGGGHKPSEVYARYTPMGVLNSDGPKIAILLGGMGLNAKLTAQAIKDLPPDISFAFAPYGSDLQAQVNRARAEGHEIMLQLPMEPVGYPARNPGPKTLLADGSEAENREALLWHMSRFAGYTGITNYMGGRFLTSPASMKPVMGDMKKRGLVFLEDAMVPLSSTAAVAKAANLPARRAQIVIDGEPDPASIARALKQLEAEASANGIAIGTGSGLDITIEAVAAWAAGLQERGITLVPVSAVFKGRMS